VVKVEAGDPAVTMGTYLRVMAVLGLERDIALVAAEDTVGRRLQDAGLATRRRAPKRAAKAPNEDRPSDGAIAPSSPES
jgi:hypothetical protein